MQELLLPSIADGSLFLQIVNTASRDSPVVRIPAIKTANCFISNIKPFYSSFYHLIHAKRLVMNVQICPVFMHIISLMAKVIYLRVMVLTILPMMWIPMYMYYTGSSHSSKKQGPYSNAQRLWGISLHRCI